MSTVELRAFNEAGIRAFEDALNEMENAKSFASLDAVVFNSDLTEKLSTQKIIEVRDFETRMDCGKYFFEMFETIKTELQSAGIDPITDKGLWTWISAFWGEIILKNSRDAFYVGDRSRYVLESGGRRDYRHLLAGPFNLYRASYLNPKNIEIAMTKKVTQDNPFFEQVASRREIVSNPAALEIIRNCYFDETTQSGYDHAAKGSLPGDLARFGSLYSQLAVNFDLRSMSSEEISALLPVEFNDWLQGNPPSIKKRAKRKTSKKRAKRAKQRKLGS